MYQRNSLLQEFCSISWVLLAAVHGIVCLFVERIEIHGVIPTAEGTTCTDADRLIAQLRNVNGFKGGDHAAPQATSLFGRGDIHSINGEFIAAEAHYNIAVAAGFPETSGNCLDDSIADGMAIGVIDGLEMIAVHDT